MEKLTFEGENGESIEFEIIADTRISGVDYLLVATPEQEGEEQEALILKDISKPGDPESDYVILDDPTELDAVAKVFEEDADIELS